MKWLVAWLFRSRPRVSDQTIIRGKTAAEHRARMLAQFSHDDAAGTAIDARHLLAQWLKQTLHEPGTRIFTSSTYRVAYEQAQEELMKKISP